MCIYEFQNLQSYLHLFFRSTKIMKLTSTPKVVHLS